MIAMEKHIFIASKTDRLIFPVTPEAHDWESGIGKKVVNIHGFGEYAIPGRPTAPSKVLEVLLPAQNYAFCQNWQPQDVIVAWLNRVMEKRIRIQYVVTEANLSGFFYITNVHFTEKDGPGNFYAKITLQKAPVVSVPTVAEAAAGATPRSEPVEAKSTVTERTVKKGDNLWTICREVYSDGSLCHKLAAYNGIKNANVISVGQVLKLPPVSVLQKGATA